MKCVEKVGCNAKNTNNTSRSREKERRGKDISSWVTKDCQRETGKGVWYREVDSRKK